MKPTFLLLTSLAALNAAANPAITVYNQGVAVIRETIPLDLTAGQTSVSFDQATSQVRPDSVVLRDPSGKVMFSILEQSYRNDPVSQSLMMSVFEGQTIDFVQQLQDGSQKIVQGEIIRSGYQPGGHHSAPIIKVDGKMQFQLPGQPLFPALGDDSILRPTLSWQIANDAAAKLDAQLSYMSGGFSWQATYNVVAPEKGETVSLNGWVTVKNHSGTGFKEANLKLVAGDVNVHREALAHLMDGASLGKSMRSAPAPVTEKSFDDFHLYTLPRPLTIRDRETKQVGFLSTETLQATKRYVYQADHNRFYGHRSYDPMQREYPQDVLTYWEFENTDKNGLGVPFPAGNIRFYRSDDADGNLEFVGENRINHTPKNETISVNTGTAFDLLGAKKHIDYQVSRSKDWARETIELTLTNRSKEVKTITVREPLWRWNNWEIEKSSMEFTKVDAQTIEFTVEVPADEKVTITYTAHYFDR